MTTPPPLIQLNDVSLHYQQRLVLKAINLSLQPNRFMTLIGPNGAGKTSLVKIMLGLITPDSGRVQRLPNLRIGYTPQRLHINDLMPLTVQRFLQLSGVKQRDTIVAVLTEVGVPNLLRQSIHNLSGGEFQRVLLARALLRKPDLLVLDEPIQGVDINGQYALYELIAQIKQQRGCGVLMVSHDLHLVMAATDDVICLNQHICCTGHPQVVSQHPAYLELFGSRMAQDLAIYRHQHHCVEHPLDETCSTAATKLPQG